MNKMYSNIVSFQEIMDDQDCFCGAALGQVRAADQKLYTHVVFLYKFDGNLKTIHYMGGKIGSVNTGTLEEKQYIAIKAHREIQDYFPDEDSRVIAKVLCENILQCEDEVRFSFEYSNQYFETKGKLLCDEEDSSTSFGLSCATLILALFKSEDMGGFDLLDIENWEHNNEDEEFMQSVCSTFGSVNDDTKSKIEVVKDYYRYRPEDIGVAFLSGIIPCGYSQCRLEYKNIHEKITG